MFDNASFENLVGEYVWLLVASGIVTGVVKNADANVLTLDKAKVFTGAHASVVLNDAYVSYVEIASWGNGEFTKP